MGTSIRQCLLAFGILLAFSLGAQNKTASDYYDAGHEKMLQKEDYNGALEEYATCIKLSKDEKEIASAYVCRGNCYKALKEYNKAMSEYKKSLEIHDDWMAHHNIAMLYMVQQEYKKALSELNLAEELEPRKAAIQQSIAELYHDMGDNENACKSWKRAQLLGLARESNVQFDEICK